MPNRYPGICYRCGKPVEPGAGVFEKTSRAHPFTQEWTESWAQDADGIGEKPAHYIRWRPGAWGNKHDGNGGVYAFAHAMGKCVFEVFGEFRPSPFPTRVCFTQQFITPDGEPLKRSGLKIKTVDAFKRQIAGLPFEYEIDPDAAPLGDEPKGDDHG